MDIKILGTGCPSCKVLEENTQNAVKELKLQANIEKITDIAKIMEYGVMSLPGLVIDGKVVSYGKTLNPKEIKELLK